jgi:hypothetical protein
MRNIGVSGVQQTEEDRLQSGLLKLAIILRKDPSRDLDELIREISVENGLDRAKFSDFVTANRQFVTATAAGSAK